MEIRFFHHSSSSWTGVRFSSGPSLLALLLILVMSGTGHGAGGNTHAVPLPDHPPVMRPGPDVPTATAALSGAWEGTWSNGRRSVLVVYQVEKGRARLLHAFDESGDWLARRQWARAAIVPGERPRLEWKDNWSSTSFELSPRTGELSGEIRESQREGGVKTCQVVMRRRSVETSAPGMLKTPLVCPKTAERFSRIAAEGDQSKRLALVDAYVGQAKKSGTPLTEPGTTAETTCATFIFRGAGEDVGIAGDMNGWSEQKDPMTRLPGTDLFYFCGEYPADSRIEYRLVNNGVSGLDPLNPRVSVFGQGSNSEAPMPGYTSPPELQPAPVAARGTVEEFAIDSPKPGMARTATVYLPVGYSGSTERYPVLYLNDAFGALKFGSIINILDNIIHQKAIPPLIVVLLPSVKDRIAEYGMNPLFEAFMAEDAVPAVDRRYRTRPSPEFRAVGGISAGATAALSLAIRHPDLFGKCMAQSTATKLAPLIALARSGPESPLRVYLDVGSFEADFNGIDLVEASRRIRAALAGHGCTVDLRVVNEGHGWRNWRARTREALTFLFASSAGNRTHPDKREHEARRGRK